jgi:hypothetical protein
LQCPLYANQPSLYSAELLSAMIDINREAERQLRSDAQTERSSVTSSLQPGRLTALGKAARLPACLASRREFRNEYKVRVLSAENSRP